MKRLFIIFTLVVISLGLNAQRVYTIDNDTVKGNENIYLTYPDITGTYSTLVLEIDFTKVSSAAGGTAYLQVSGNGTNYSTVTEYEDLFIFYPNDTVTITDGGTMKAIIKSNPFNNYRWFIDGDASDTVIIAPSYLYKK